MGSRSSTCDWEIERKQREAERISTSRTTGKEDGRYLCLLLVWTLIWNCIHIFAQAQTHTHSAQSSYKPSYAGMEAPVDVKNCLDWVWAVAERINKSVIDFFICSLGDRLREAGEWWRGKLSENKGRGRQTEWEWCRGN